MVPHGFIITYFFGVGRRLLFLLPFIVLDKIFPAAFFVGDSLVVILDAVDNFVSINPFHLRNFLGLELES